MPARLIGVGAESCRPCSSLEGERSPSAGTTQMMLTGPAAKPSSQSQPLSRHREQYRSPASSNFHLPVEGGTPSAT